MKKIIFQNCPVFQSILKCARNPLSLLLNFPFFRFYEAVFMVFSPIKMNLIEIIMNLLRPFYVTRSSRNIILS